ncbi:hypothetical protein OpiT1DRAFT_05946 [Opitutaceae bacterium TAV1]|nr:hypothetical protein OpiT1DRAFT_05946 [Opitutaceae bacterium TAV1]
MKTSFKTLAATLACLGLASFAHAQSTSSTTWEYDFTGSSATALGGLSTGLASDGSAALTWTASANFKADGSTVDGGGSAWLAYDFQDGFTYTLSVDVDSRGLPQTGTSGNFAGISLTTDSSNTGAFGRTTPHHGVLALRTKTAAGTLPAHTFYPTPASDNFTSARTLSANTSTATLTFILDTTGTDWTYEVSIGGTSLTGILTRAELEGLGLVANAAGAKFGNLSFTATQAIPEPSACALILGGIFIPLALWRARARIRHR